MHALDAVYHLPFLTALYNEQHTFEQQQQAETAAKEAQRDYSYRYAESIALAELISFVEERASRL